jgi:hypothetical protein
LINAPKFLLAQEWAAINPTVLVDKVLIAMLPTKVGDTAIVPGVHLWAGNTLRTDKKLQRKYGDFLPMFPSSGSRKALQR